MEHHCYAQASPSSVRTSCPHFKVLPNCKRDLPVPRRIPLSGRVRPLLTWPRPSSGRFSKLCARQYAAATDVTSVTVDSLQRSHHLDALGQGIAGLRNESAGLASSERAAVSQGNGGQPPATPPPSGGRDSAPGQQANWLQPRSNGLDTVVTFAYGANMNFLTLARREVRVLSRDPAVVDDPRVHLVFKHQGGYATLERAEEAGAGAATSNQPDEPRFRPYDGQVHGVLYRVTREDFDKLAKREGGYMVQEVQVRTYDGTPYTALVFVSNPLFKLPQEVLPTEKYLSVVREGARDNYLDPGYQGFLSGISTVPGAGLGAEYYNTPSKYLGYSFLAVVALITVAFFFQN